MTMTQLREHPWILGTKFGGAGSADQGTFDASAEVDEDGPTYRGIGGYPKSFDEPMMMDDDEMPVYRSLGMSSEDEMAGAMPMLNRQKAKSNIYGAAADPMGFDPFA
jgi:hypothetical protein